MREFLAALVAALFGRGHSGARPSGPPAIPWKESRCAT
jgi:hypothetical protein